MSEKNFDIQGYMTRGVERVIKNILKTAAFSQKESAFMAKFAIEAGKASRRRDSYERQGTHVPPFLIASITDKCNLNCAGCYARALHSCSDQGRDGQMSAEDWSRIFGEARELGVSFILLAGGEPLVRRDVIREAAQVKEVLFPVFTNGTMLKGDYLTLFDDHRNLVPVISIEGDRNHTDSRRGTGMYDTVLSVMGEMKKKHIAFGVSITVTTENLREVTSRDYLESLKELGCKVVVFVEYVPVSEETEGLAPGQEDRLYFDGRLSDLRKEFEDLLFLAFPGDEKNSDGCLAAGRGFFHINARGGAEPCPFSPYSDVNAKERPLKEVLDSPLFKALRESDMLVEDHRGGCVLYERRERVEALLNMGNSD